MKTSTSFQPIDIIIISYNTSILTTKCVQSIYDTTKDNISITVVDNNSTDDTIPSLQRNYSRVKIIQNKRNLGYAAAINIGMQQTLSEYIIVSNTDVIFHRNTINNLIDYMHTHAKVGAVGPQQLYADGSWQRSYGSTPGISSAVKHLLGVTFIVHFINKFFWPLIKNIKIDKSVGYIDGAVIGFKRSAFKSIGGFDDAFFFFGEDADFCQRLKKAGWKVMTLPIAQVIHLRGGSFTSIDSVFNKKRSQMLIDAKKKMVKKRYSSWMIDLYILVEKTYFWKMELFYYILVSLTKGQLKNKCILKHKIFRFNKQAWDEEKSGQTE
ncbi:Glycosyltransferase, GT2 family [Candidatus Electrothrix aarhusensis]|uniref:Glycosyltransferase, GT2 family n=1 Tax=Candidatus Electrothrix aarhusensis TaxID=1859131 RepID=A0A444IW81_9BACT|nr:Glycosyltransferase, GT2 family [Candidatus Electrothrix aarhusensis]